MSRYPMIYAVMITVLIVAAVPFVVMSWRRNKVCRYFSVAHLFLFLGVVLSAWSPWMHLTGGGEATVFFVEFSSILIYGAVVLWVLIKSQRIYHRTGKWPNLWDTGDPGE